MRATHAPHLPAAEIPVHEVIADVLVRGHVIPHEQGLPAEQARDGDEDADAEHEEEQLDLYKTKTKRVGAA